jgi:hypothetical protein
LTDEYGELSLSEAYAADALVGRYETGEEGPEAVEKFGSESVADLRAEEGFDDADDQGVDEIEPPGEVGVDVVPRIDQIDGAVLGIKLKDGVYVDVDVDRAWPHDRQTDVYSVLADVQSNGRA